MTSLASRIWTVFLIGTAITVIILFVFSKYIYESIYVTEIEQTLEVQSKNLALEANGAVTDAFIQKVETYNELSPIDVFAVRNPRELSACLPFEIDYDALITGEDRQQLVDGEFVVKRGYQSRFDREVISFIYPIVEDKRLEGIIYSYIPLSPVTDFLKKNSAWFALGAVLLFALAAVLSRAILNSLLRPIDELLHVTEQFKTGNYKIRSTYSSKNELGELSSSFNRMADAVEAEDERKKEFLSVVSHELRTPLSSIVGYSQALASKQVEEKRQDEVIGLLHSEAERMKKLTEDLLMIARNEELPRQFLPLVGAEILYQAVQILDPLIRREQMNISIEADDELIVYSDESALLQIIINILENAVRYSTPGDDIILRLKAKGNEAEFSVTDHGEGIAEEHLPHLTERFYRVNKARTRMDGGSGLGLTIVQQMVSQLQGKLTIQSEKEKGTIVQFTVPLWKEE